MPLLCTQKLSSEHDVAFPCTNKIKHIKYSSTERGGITISSTEHLNYKLEIQSQQAAQKVKMLDIRLKPEFDPHVVERKNQFL